MQADFFHIFKIEDNRGYTVGMLKTGRPAKRDRTAFGERVFLARQRKGLTQAELAEKVGAVQQVVAEWERHACALKPDQLKALATALDVSADYLLGISSSRQVKGPSGKMRQVFEEASQLPRRQQQKIIDVLEPFVAQRSATS